MSTNQRPDFLVGNSLNSCPDWPRSQKKLTLHNKILFSYPLGESFEDEALDGRFCSVLMVLECPDKLVTHQTSLDIDPPINTVVSRKFSADKMIMTLQCQGVTATAEYKRV